MRERLTRSVLVLLPSLPVASNPTVLPHQVTKELDRKFSSLRSVTSLALRFPANTKLHLQVFNNFKSTARTISKCIPVILHRHTVLQTRCIANVITPL